MSKKINYFDLKTHQFRFSSCDSVPVMSAVKISVLRADCYFGFVVRIKGKNKYVEQWRRGRDEGNNHLKEKTGKD